MAGKKSTKIVVNQRIQKIVKWYSLGYTYSQIHQFGAEEGWGLHRRSIDDYITAAIKLVNEHSRETTKESASLIISNLWYLYRMNISKNPNSAVARLCLMDIAKMTGHLNYVAPASTGESSPEAEELSNEDLADKLKNAG